MRAVFFLSSAGCALWSRRSRRYGRVMTKGHDLEGRGTNSTARTRTHTHTQNTLRASTPLSHRPRGSLLAQYAPPLLPASAPQLTHISRAALTQDPHRHASRLRPSTSTSTGGESAPRAALGLSSLVLASGPSSNAQQKLRVDAQAGPRDAATHISHHPTLRTVACCPRRSTAVKHLDGDRAAAPRIRGQEGQRLVHRPSVAAYSPAYA